MDAKSKKLYAIGGVIGIAVVGIIYLRNKNSGGSTSGTGNIDPSTGFPYGSQQDQAALAAQGTGSEVDPSTGYPYGSAQDNAALAAVGSGGAYPYQDSGAGYGYVPQPTAPGGSLDTNAAWSQAVEQTLTAIGYSPTDVSGAVGRYLAKLPLTEAQANIIQVALAEEGNPPQGSYSIITAPPPPIVTPPRPTVVVPNVVGLSQVQADAVLNSEGFKAEGTKETAKKGSVYVVTSQSPKAGSHAAKGSTVKLNAQVKK